jgi:hypothetical protein
MASEAEDELPVAIPMTIQIKPAKSGKVLRLANILPTTTIFEIKVKLCDMTQVDVSRQRLIYKGKQPDVNWTMADLGIVNGTKRVYCEVR